jgi:hypothetical protein
MREVRPGYENLDGHGRTARRVAPPANCRVRNSERCYRIPGTDPPLASLPDNGRKVLVGQLVEAGDQYVRLDLVGHVGADRERRRKDVQVVGRTRSSPSMSS